MMALFNSMFEIIYENVFISDDMQDGHIVQSKVLARLDSTIFLF